MIPFEVEFETIIERSDPFREKRIQSDNSEGLTIECTSAVK